MARRYRPIRRGRRRATAAVRRAATRRPRYLSDALLALLVFGGATAFVVAVVLAPVVLQVAVVLVAFGGTVGTFVQWRRGRASASWPPARGVVVACGIERWWDSDGTSTMVYRKFGAHVRYEYTVDGRRYVGSRVAYALRGSRQAWSAETARGVCARYPVGHPVTVHYDPGRPGRAVLETGFSMDFVFLGPLLGFLILAARVLIRDV